MADNNVDVELWNLRVPLVPPIHSPKETDDRNLPVTGLRVGQERQSRHWLFVVQTIVGHGSGERDRAGNSSLNRRRPGRVARCRASGGEQPAKATQPAGVRPTRSAWLRGISPVNRRACPAPICGDALRVATASSAMRAPSGWTNRPQS